MLAFTKMKNSLTRLTEAITRFPLTTVFLLAAAITNAISIGTAKNDYDKYLYMFIVGTVLSAALQVAYERFFATFASRLLLMGAGILLTAGYYLIIMNSPTFSIELSIRTLVTNFALFIAFIWVPVMKSNISFNQSFMISFKSFFNSLFYSGVIFAGLSIIILAIDQLIFTIHHTSYPHTANIVFVLFAPMYFLSLIPVFPGAADRNKNQEQLDVQTETIRKAAHCPKFLEVLISYIIIPLVAVFTFILLIYIIQNIGGDFWTDNLLEPMLVSYAITVILVYILASEMNNSFAVWFRKIFPKLLVPIVVFQIVSSSLRMMDMGLTHDRYYVILFGVFAAISGISLSFLPVRKNGIIAALLIVCSAISIVPPVDAFTMSRESQTETLENVLIKNNMLENNEIKANPSISNEDKEIITNTVAYLDRMAYTKKIEWMPSDFNMYEDFADTFGFEEYYPEFENQGNEYVYVTLNDSSALTVDIAPYDTFIKYNMDINRTGGKFADFEKAGKDYTLVQKTIDGKAEIILMGQNNEKLISFSTGEIIDRYANRTTRKEEISPEEATFSIENDQANMTFLVRNASIDKTQNPMQYSAELFIFVNIK